MKRNTARKEAGWVKWEVLLLLWMAYLLNQGDRQVFNTVLPSIREALNLTDTSVGLIATLFNLFYAFMVPLGGWMGGPFQPQMGGNLLHSVLERRDNVHRNCQQCHYARDHA